MSRNAAPNFICWDVFGHYGSRCDYGIVTNCDTLEYGGVSANPYVAPEPYGLMVQILSLFRIKVVIERRHHHAVAYQTAIADIDAALVLELATGVDEHIAVHMDVLAKIGVERREHPERLMHLFANDFAEKLAHLLGCMEVAVKFELEAARLIALIAHEFNHFRSFKRLPFGYKFLEFSNIHLLKKIIPGFVNVEMHIGEISDLDGISHL